MARSSSRRPARSFCSAMKTSILTVWAPGSSLGISFAKRSSTKRSSSMHLTTAVATVRAFCSRFAEVGESPSAASAGAGASRGAGSCVAAANS